MNYLEAALKQIEALQETATKNARECDERITPYTKANCEGRARAYEMAAKIVRELLEMENREQNEELESMVKFLSSEA